MWRSCWTIKNIRPHASRSIDRGPENQQSSRSTPDSWTNDRKTVSSTVLTPRVRRVCNTGNASAEGRRGTFSYYYCHPLRCCEFRVRTIRLSDETRRVVWKTASRYSVDHVKYYALPYARARTLFIVVRAPVTHQKGLRQVIPKKINRLAHGASRVEDVHARELIKYNTSNNFIRSEKKGLTLFFFKEKSRLCRRANSGLNPVRSGHVENHVYLLSYVETIDQKRLYSFEILFKYRQTRFFRTHQICNSFVFILSYVPNLSHASDVISCSWLHYPTDVQTFGCTFNVLIAYSVWTS